MNGFAAIRIKQALKRTTTTTVVEEEEEVALPSSKKGCVSVVDQQQQQQHQKEILFEQFKSIALQQDLLSKDVVIQELKEAHEKAIAALRAQYEALLEAHSSIDKIYKENEMLKTAIFDAKRETASMQAKLDQNTAMLSGAFQTRVHELRERSTRLINDEHAKFSTQIRGAFRNTESIDRDALLELINRYAESVRLAVGASVI